MVTDATQAQTRVPPLRAVREARGLGLREVARASGVNESHLSRVERGERAVTLDVLARLAPVLGLRELDRLISPYVRGERQ